MDKTVSLQAVMNIIMRHCDENDPILGTMVFRLHELPAETSLKGLMRTWEAFCKDRRISVYGCVGRPFNIGDGLCGMPNGEELSEAEKLLQDWEQKPRRFKYEL